MAAANPVSGGPLVSVIVPARNEEVSLGDCLESLVAQTGVAREIIVVDDASTDRTREIAESFAEVRVISAPPLPPGWTGKNNAVAAGAQEARGEWLLFTDADTVHLPGALSRSLEEARREQVDLLSYSPEQIAVTFWEMATLPVVFAELARQYAPQKVSDPASPLAAANGQFILVRSDAYRAVGGHAAVAQDLLEDVGLARAIKSSGRKIRFRYAADAVRTRMYRNFTQLREGWTKNLALLFPSPAWLAVKTLLLWAWPWSVLCLPIVAGVALALAREYSLSNSAQNFLQWLVAIHAQWWSNGIFIAGLLFITTRIRKANFTWDMEILGALFGYPMFSYLLLRSRLSHKHRKVEWKGRTYTGDFASQNS